MYTPSPSRSESLLSPGNPNQFPPAMNNPSELTEPRVAVFTSKVMFTWAITDDNNKIDKLNVFNILFITINKFLQCSHS